jgi:hypothetical protein
MTDLAAVSDGNFLLALPPPSTLDRDVDMHEIDAMDDGCRPASARHYRITDLQHWIDLSA